MSKDLRCECALFGIFGDPDQQAVETTYWGLRALQHRGEESAGIATVTQAHVDMGLVHEVFDTATLEALSPATTAIGHVRYSTTGSSVRCNAQPLIVTSSRFGRIALAMNGNLVNAPEIRKVLEIEKGAIFQTTTDAEVLLHLSVHSGTEDFYKALESSLLHLQGAYCFLILQGENLYAIRDPIGFRPLCLGEKDGCVVIASESIAFDHPQVQATYIREVAPGEILICKPDRPISSSTLPQTLPQQPLRRCVFEQVYFARPNGTVFGESVSQARIELGRRLAQEDQPPENAIVVGVPDSGLFAACGYSETAGLPLVPGLTRDHYIGRTFLHPNSSARARLVELKLSPVRYLLEGRKVVLVDDSIVRGHTSREIVRIVRDAGARAVHLRITSPPITHPCFYGIDTPRRGELIANSGDIETVRQFVEADSLRYLSLENMHAACGQPPQGPIRNCDACFTGNYPTDDYLVNFRLSHPPNKC